MKKIIAAIALLFGLGVVSAPVAEAGPYDGYASYTDCVAPAASFSYYVCFDETTGLGPVVYRYANGTMTTASAAGWTNTAGCRSFAQTPADFIAMSITGVTMAGTWPGGVPNTSVCPNIGFAGGGPQIVNGSPSGGSGAVVIVNNSTFVTNLKLAANNPSYWFIWAD